MQKEILIRPLELKTDVKCRLKIPLIIRQMLKIGAGDSFHLVITEEGDLLYSPAKK